MRVKICVLRYACEHEHTYACSAYLLPALMLVCPRDLGLLHVPPVQPLGHALGVRGVIKVQETPGLFAHKPQHVGHKGQGVAVV